MNNCIDCNKEISKNAKRCMLCCKLGKNNPMYGSSRKGKENPNYRDGNYTVREKFCLDCNKKIVTMTAERCCSCANRIKSTKHGKHLKPNYCIDCNIKISVNAKRCEKCNGKTKTGINNHRYGKGFKGSDNPMFGKVGELNPFFGKKHTEEAKNKIGSANSKGYITELHIMIRMLDEGYKWKKACLIRDKFKCIKCSATKPLEVNHIKPFSVILKDFLAKYNTFSPVEDKLILCKIARTYKDFWNIDNGETLCESCHKLVTKKQFEEGII